MTPTRRHRRRPDLEGFESRQLPSLSLLPATPAIVRVEARTAGHLGAARPLDTQRFPDERRKVAGWSGEYPLLEGRYEVLGPSTGRYNCISHSLGIHNRWINPRVGPHRNPLRWADRVYGARGYHRLPTLDYSLQEGVRKVVVYGSENRKGVIWAVRHAAIQMADGAWSSKLGDGPLIRHLRPQAVGGSEYGRPIAVYARPWAAVVR